MKTNRKKWNFAVRMFIAAIFLTSFIPAVEYVRGISTIYYSSAYGPMGGRLVDESGTNFLFYLAMTIYSFLISALSVVVYQLMKK